MKTMKAAIEYSYVVVYDEEDAAFQQALARFQKRVGEQATAESMVNTAISVYHNHGGDVVHPDIGRVVPVSVYPDRPRISSLTPWSGIYIYPRKVAWDSAEAT